MKSFEKTPCPVEAMEAFIDDNVRRCIARQAGIQTCIYPDHTQCQADTTSGISHGIHNNWHDLKQVKVPAQMSLLEKMQCEYDMSLMRSTTHAAIDAEVERLIREGITLNTGCLSQETLKSLPARKTLLKLGIHVHEETRDRYCKDFHGTSVMSSVLQCRFADSGRDLPEPYERVLFPVKPK